MTESDPGLPPGTGQLLEPYWRGLTEGRIDLQRCLDCRRFIHLPEPLCPGCRGTNLGVETASRHGTLHTYTAVHRAHHPALAELAPYVVGWVELPDQAGLKVLGVLDVDDEAAVSVGMRLVLAPPEPGSRLASWPWSVTVFRPGGALDPT